MSYWILAAGMIVYVSRKHDGFDTLQATLWATWSIGTLRIRINTERVGKPCAVVTYTLQALIIVSRANNDKRTGNG